MGARGRERSSHTCATCCCPAPDPVALQVLRKNTARIKELEQEVRALEIAKAAMSSEHEERLSGLQRDLHSLERSLESEKEEGEERLRRAHLEAESSLQVMILPRMPSCAPCPLPGCRASCCLCCCTCSVHLSLGSDPCLTVRVRTCLPH